MLKNNLGYKVTTRLLDWNQKVRGAWGSEFSAPDHGMYEFSNGRKFDSTDRGLTGIYGISGINYLMVGDGRYPDMTSNVHMLQETLDKIELE
jgi:hypothetical protein